jgi:hypothetical protein
MSSAQEAKEIVNQMNQALRVLVLPSEELLHRCTEECLREVNSVACSFVNREGRECGEEAAVQLLPDGDEARCVRHLDKETH